jgi:3'(2'), 5'-bisphosphate nucleotidase
MKFYEEPEFIDQIVQIAEEAGLIIMDVYDNPDTYQNSVEYKEDDSPLTIADQKASNYICDELLKISDILIICEETKNADYDERSQHEYVWLIDPLDGTKEFIKRNGEFTVNIGLAHNSRSVFGVVNIPCQNKTYVGVDGVGSYVLEDGNRLSIQVSDNRSLNNAKVVISRSHLNDETQEFISRYSDPTTVPIGSSIKMLLVADGTADIYPRIGPTMEWDTCAAHAVVKGAGGQIYVYKDGQFNEEVSYNKENLLNPLFVCDNH